MQNLEEHKKQVAKAFGPLVAEYIETVWDDAIASCKEQKSNSASDKSLEKFASFIIDGLDLDSLMENYKLVVVKRLEALSDEELKEEKEFYGYKGDL